ncbi:hypothetical protein RJ640_017757 [Escallonia rubra]|uniref:non-specific serine/threonine protein kinase n=1 Tax=Escallonia rubra TaxID=112253 RepID=A0AA88QRA7_9ASTE|nr:hypothetical protein RJ640_017757 [Escallonia rubra]
MSSESLNAELSKKILGLKLWVVIGICVGAFIIMILCILSIWLTFRRNSRKSLDKYSISQIPNVSKEIKVDRVGGHNFHDQQDSLFVSIHDKSSDKNSEKTILVYEYVNNGNLEQWLHGAMRQYGVLTWEARIKVLLGTAKAVHYNSGKAIGRLVFCTHEIGRDLPHPSNEYATSAVVYRFTVLKESELMENYYYAAEESNEDTHIEYYKLAYLHEAIEPKVVHRDIKSSNILIDTEFNGKLSDFGLAKLLDSGESHITTRVMGTFGYVAPEYANTGLLNEKSDVYSFGVLLLEAVTGRDPVDYGRPANEVNLVEWLKLMVGNRRAEEVLDPTLEPKPATRALKRALLVALRCVDPDSEKRPKMSQVVRMLEADEFPSREDRRNRKSRTSSMDIESMKESCGSADLESKAELSESHLPEMVH